MTTLSKSPDELRNSALDTAEDLKAAAIKAASNFKESAIDTAKNLKDSALDATQNIRENARETARKACSSASEGLSCGLASTRVFVRESPVTSIAAVLVCGVAVGWLMASGRQPNLRKQFLEEPLDDAYSSLSGVLSRLGGNLKFW